MPERARRSAGWRFAALGRTPTRAEASATEPPAATNAARTSTWRAVGVRGSEPCTYRRTCSPCRKRPAAPHVHPRQEERFEVLAGRLKVSIDGVETVLGPGDVAITPPGIPHTWFNVGDAEAHVVVDIRPALRSEMFFETLFGLAADGRTDRNGLPRPLQLATLATEFSDEVRLARPSAVVQRVLFEPLAALGRLRGYRGWHPRYSSNPIDEPSNPVRSSSPSW